MDIAEHKQPQDGSFSALKGENRPSFRVASVGAFGGEKITIRVLSSDMNRFRLDTLGFRQEHYMKIVHTLQQASGMILICGPTGSGKTSTLYTMLNTIDFN